MPRDNGRRVAEGARHVSPPLGGRVIAAPLDDCSVVIRGLMPQHLKFKVEPIDVGRSQGRAFSCACRRSGALESDECGNSQSLAHRTPKEPAGTFRRPIVAVAEHRRIADDARNTRRRTLPALCAREAVGKRISRRGSRRTAICPGVAKFVRGNLLDGSLGTEFP